MLKEKSGAPKLFFFHQEKSASELKGRFPCFRENSTISRKSVWLGGFSVLNENISVIKMHPEYLHVIGC